METLPYNMDRRIRLSVETESMLWRPSPMAGVLRKALEREKAESGEVTSIVQYAPGSTFSAHVHPAGEEIFVLEGEFADEYGRYPQGSYLRNPAGSKHSPFSDTGCTLFVKLNQFQAGDSASIRTKTHEETWFPGQGKLRVMPLHEFEGHSTALVKWPPGTHFQPHQHWGGEEIFVLEGVFQDEHGQYPAGTWIRSPHMSRHNPYSELGCTILVKVGHL